jgi:hypothetical protein
MHPFWLSAEPPSPGGSPTTAILEESGLDAALRLSALIRRKVLGLIARRTAADPQRFLREVRVILRRYEPEMARTISDATLAAWLMAGRSVAAMLPAMPGAVAPRRGRWGQLLDWPADDEREAEPEVEGDTSPVPFTPPAMPPQGPRRPRITTGLPDDDDNIELPVIDEAVRDLIGRRILTRGDYIAASSEARQQAFTVAGLATEDAVSRVRDALAEAVDQGQTLREFRTKLGEDLETSRLGPGRVENTFRTGVLGAYANGMEAVRKSPLVRSELPFAVTEPIRDSRLSEMCKTAAESGLHDVNGQRTNVYYAEDQEWKRTRPIRHYQCRCGMLFLSLQEAAERGIAAARRWLRTGIQPAIEELCVPRVPIELPDGWTR